MGTLSIEPMPGWAEPFYETPTKLSRQGEVILAWMESLGTSSSVACARAIRDWDISTARANGLQELSVLWRENRVQQISSP